MIFLLPNALYINSRSTGYPSQASKLYGNTVVTLAMSCGESVGSFFCNLTFIVTNSVKMEVKFGDPKAVNISAGTYILAINTCCPSTCHLAVFEFTICVNQLRCVVPSKALDGFVISA